MSRYTTGLYKGEEIMTEFDRDLQWNAHGGNVFILREFDIEMDTLDTFRVSERLRGNTHTIWAENLKFEKALILAERLVIGKDYIPPHLLPQIPVVTDIDVGELLPGSFHMHRSSSLELQKLYDPDVIKPQRRLLVKRILKNTVSIITMIRNGSAAVSVMNSGWPNSIENR